MDLALGDCTRSRRWLNGITTEKADLLFASVPYKILHGGQVPVYQEMARATRSSTPSWRAGFDLDFGVDGSGLFMKYLRRGSGLLHRRRRLGADHRRPGQAEEPGRSKITGNAVVMDDGTELEADLIVYATGYGSMNGWLADLVSPEIADKVGKCWGLRLGHAKRPGPWEGELRNMWKPTQRQEPVDPRRQPAPVRHYSSVPGAAAQGPDGRAGDAGVAAQGHRAAVARGDRPLEQPFERAVPVHRACRRAGTARHRRPRRPRASRRARARRAPHRAAETRPSRAAAAESSAMPPRWPAPPSSWA
jgi:hypothetical protein